MGQQPSVVRSAEAREKDKDDALNWIRGAHTGTDDDAAFAEFKRIDAFLPKKEGQSEEDRAAEMADALDWIRSNDLDVKADESAVGTFEGMGQQPSVERSAEAREKDKDDALNWIRGAHTGTDDDAAFAEFKRIDAFLPKKEGQSEEDRAAEMADALDWIRSNDLDVKADESAVSSFEGLGQQPSVVRSHDLAVDQKDVDVMSSWLRGDKDASLDPIGVFKQLDESVPVKKGQSLEERATDLTKALNWMRTEGLLKDFENEPFEAQISTKPVIPTDRAPEQKLKDLE